MSHLFARDANASMRHENLCLAWLREKEFLLQTYTGRNKFQFSCQHGPAECEGNIYHACAAAHIKDDDDMMEYVKCMINDNYNPARAALSCSQEVDTVDWTTISACATGAEGNVLHKLAGDKTHELRPRVIA